MPFGILFGALYLHARALLHDTYYSDGLRKAHIVVLLHYSTAMPVYTREQADELDG